MKSVGRDLIACAELAPNLTVSPRQGDRENNGDGPLIVLGYRAGDDSQAQYLFGTIHSLDLA